MANCSRERSCLSSLSLKVNINTSIIELNHNVLLRWCMVPSRVAPNCFRDIWDIWWMCSKVRRLCIRAYNFIYSVTQTNIKKSLRQDLFSQPFKETLVYTKMQISLIFLAAKIAIARSWKSPSISFYLNRAKLSWIMINEKVTAVLMNIIYLFIKKM